MLIRLLGRLLCRAWERPEGTASAVRQEVTSHPLCTEEALVGGCSLFHSQATLAIEC